MRCLAVFILPLAFALPRADEVEDGEEAPPRPALQMRILDELSTQVDGKTIVRDEGNDLRLNCSLNRSSVPLTPNPPTIVWYIPSSVSSRLHKRPGPGYMVLSVTALQMDDSGNFSCEARLADQSIVIRSFRLHVRSQMCGDGQFQCTNGNCIGQVFVCDGLNDCADARDEELNTCGEKVTCGAPRPGTDERFLCGHRCRQHNYCCFQGNCTTGKFVNEHEPCCKRYIELTANHYHRPYEPDRSHYDRTYLETAIYTIIGCAVAFILIVSIMIVAFCRLHLRQSARLSSYSHLRPTRAAAGSAHPALPPDLDRLMWAGAGAPLPACFSAGPGHMMVTYNINNGVQVMPLLKPPSYSEAVQGSAAAGEPSPSPAGGVSATASASAAAGPPAGPPPPYASRESLHAEPALYPASENNNGDINGNSVSSAEPAAASPPT